MAMQSVGLLPDLEALPGDDGHRSFEDAIADLRANDPLLTASELVASVSIGLWAIWDRINMSDSLAQAYETQYPSLAAENSLHEHWQEIQAEGENAATGFISGLKGKLAEIRAAEILEDNGYGDVSIAASPVQDGWDISAVNDAGETEFFQVKTGGEGYAHSVGAEMEDAEDLHFLLSSALYDRISEDNGEFVDRITDIGPDYLLVEGMEDGLLTLSENNGIDIPDSLGEFLPGVAVIVLIYGAIKNEGEFKDADRTTKNKIQVVRTLTLMSRFGVSTVLTTIGMAGGTAAWPVVGTIAGAAGGFWGARKLNKSLQPRLLELALNITGLTSDDLFYFKNKRRIDDVARTFHEQAEGLYGMT